jgi:hypothetical protein
MRAIPANDAKGGDMTMDASNKIGSVEMCFDVTGQNEDRLQILKNWIESSKTIEFMFEIEDGLGKVYCTCFDPKVGPIVIKDGQAVGLRVSIP